MDIKKFSMFVIVLGILIAAYGGYNLFSLYQKFHKEISLIDNRQDFAGKITAPHIKWSLERELREEKSWPIVVLVAGGIVIFIGGALNYSSKKS